MDPLETARKTLPTPVRRRLAETPVNRVFDDLRSSKFYSAVRKRLTEADRVSFDTGLGEFSLLVSGDANGLLVEKAGQPGGYEPGLVETLADTLSEDDTVFDVGGGFGYNGALARAAGIAQHRIHLFEADRLKADFCRRNHPGATVTNCFVGDGDLGTLAIDAYVRRADPPTVVLIDIEGAEFDALMGMYRTLSTYHPVLLVELHPELLDEGGRSIDDIYRYLRDLDYDLAAMNHRVRDGEWSDDIDTPDVSSEAYTPTFLLTAR